MSETYDKDETENVNIHIDRAYSMAQTTVDADSIEGLSVMLDAVMESNFGIAYEARTANMLKMIELDLISSAYRTEHISRIAARMRIID